ncbi:MAG TPA: hypothetical protein VGO68_10575 [Pyrinomonadaceae bacterium]|nr:hypothetical protein [Pyrinomonadaceae bacterium]
MERAIMVVKTAVYSDIKVRNRPSFYAPPVAWAVANFTQSLIEAEGGIVPHQTGMIVVSDECSLSTIRDLSRTAAQGNISPLRFAGASPSIVVGLPALEQGIRGPTVCLTMAPVHASNAILAMINYWIRYSNIVSVIAIAHYKQDERRHLFKGLIARSAGDELRPQVLQLIDSQTGEIV